MFNDYFPNASQLVYGCMGLGGSWDNVPASKEHYTQAHEVVEAALECGINVFDHADIYTYTKAAQLQNVKLCLRANFRMA